MGYGGHTTIWNPFLAGCFQHKSHCPSWHVLTLVNLRSGRHRVLLMVVVCIKSGLFSKLACPSVVVDCGYCFHP